MFNNKVPVQMTVLKKDGTILWTTDVTREFLSATLDDMTKGNIVNVPSVKHNRLYVVPVSNIDYIHFDFEDEDGDD